jgi:hypothetical protein
MVAVALEGLLSDMRPSAAFGKRQVSERGVVRMRNRVFMKAPKRPLGIVLPDRPMTGR